MTLSLFRRRASARHATPQHQPVTVPVNVTATIREAKPDGIEWTPPDAETVAHIDAHLPNRPISENLRAARFAAVLDREAAFLADKTGTVEPPEREALIDALQFAAGFIFDRIVIA